LCPQTRRHRTIHLFRAEAIRHAERAERVQAALELAQGVFGPDSAQDIIATQHEPIKRRRERLQGIMAVLELREQQGRIMRLPIKTDEERLTIHPGLQRFGECKDIEEMEPLILIIPKAADAEPEHALAVPADGRKLVHRS
jgi:hypothetical protein